MKAMPGVASLAAVGAGAGFLVAGREVLRQGYLAEGLWRTSLWVSSRGAYRGLVAGLAGGAAILLLLSLWFLLLAAESRRRGTAPSTSPVPSTRPPWALRFTIYLVALTAIALVLAPTNPGYKFGATYLDLNIALFSFLWIASSGLAAGIAFRSAEEPSSDQRPSLERLMAVAIACIVVFLHIWAGAKTWPILAALTVAASLLSVAAYCGLEWASRFLGGRATRPPATALRGRIGRALTASVLVLACGLCLAGMLSARAARAEARGRARNIILIGIDTLRADRATLLSPDEYARDLTPNLRNLLASRATVYSRAISQAPWTLPAFASIFTGLYPAEHGAEYRGSMLAPRQLTVAEILREAGFRTLGVSSGCYVTTAAGLSQGFETFDESQALGQRAITSEEVTTRAIGLLRKHSDQPFFLFVHYFEPHWIYYDHEEYPYADGYDGWLREPARQINQEDFREFIGALKPGFSKRWIAPEDLAFLNDLYDEDVAFMDSEMGRFLRFLDEAGLWENTLVIAVSDHGEEFLEHRNIGHQTTLYEELVHVPLAVADPFAPGARVDARTVETRRLFRTMLDFLEVSPPQGRVFAPSLASEADARARSSNHTLAFGADGRIFRESKNVWWTSIQDGRWKLIKEHLRGRSVLFDLENDPGETRNCRDENPDWGRRLEGELDRLDSEVRGRAPRTRVPEASEEQKRRLKSLGYL